MPLDDTTWYRSEVDFDISSYDDPVTTALREAKELIKKGWTKNKPASDGYNITNIYNENAVEFCLVGAIGRVSPNNKISDQAEIRLSQVIGIEWHEIEIWNDRWYRTKRSVLKALDRTINTPCQTFQEMIFKYPGWQPPALRPARCF